MRLIRRIREIDYRHYICVGILLGFLVLSVCVYGDQFFRTIYACRDIGTSLAYYCYTLYGIKHNILPTVTMMPHLDIDVVLPETWTGALSKSSMYWGSMLSGATYGRYFDAVGQGLAVCCMCLLLILPVLLLVWLLFRRALKAQNNDYGYASRPLRAWKAVMRFTVEPARDWLQDMIRFVRDHCVYWKIGLVIWLYHFNVFTIGAEIIAFIFYFFVSFDFGNLYVQVYKLFTDVALGFSALPWYVWIAVLIPVFQFCRHRIARKRQRRHENINRRVRDNLPIVCMLDGSMGAGKTTHMVDFALSLENDFRTQAFETMLKIDAMFPNFPWLSFELDLQTAIGMHRAFNLASCRRLIRDWQLNFDVTMDSASIWDYDVERYGMTYNDGLIVYDLFDALEIYAQAYFIYICQSSEIISNLSIRTDAQCDSVGNLPVWDFDFFDRDPERIEEQSIYAHVLNWDMLRLGKQFRDDPANNALEFGVFDITEFFKDRGNQHEMEGVKKTDLGVNQKNDRFNWTLKLCRHAATVDNYPYFKLIADDQRADSGPADLRQLMTIVSIGKEKRKGLFFPFFALEGLVCDLFYVWFSRIYKQYRYNRADNTLIMHLLHSLASRLYGYNLRIMHRYGFTRTRLTLTDGKDDSEIADLPYYLAYKKIYAKRFDTACYRDFFARRALSSGVGLDDMPEYEDVTATLDELRQQQSYMIRELDASTSGTSGESGEN